MVVLPGGASGFFLLQSIDIAFLTHQHSCSKCAKCFSREINWPGLSFLEKGPTADATEAPQPLRLIVQPYDEDKEKDD